MAVKKVGFARSTWELVKEFHDGLSALEERIPLALAREYLASGVRRREVEESVYAEIDRLQALRRRGIGSQRIYAVAQAKFWLSAHPEEGARRAERWGTGTGSPEEFLGEAVLAGDDLRPGLGAGVYEVAPSLQIYDQFMWIGLKELEETAQRLLEEE